MFVVAIDSVEGAVASLERQLDRHAGKDLAWALMYTVEGAPIAELVAAARRKFPGLPVFGATSFQGVFSSQGFHRGAGVLFGERSEATRVAVTVSASDAKLAFDRARSACSALVESLGGQPQMLLLHATPGFEEKVLAGIASVFSGDVPVYGGSAADDEIAGQWRVFANESVVKQGFLLVGIVSDIRPSGGFLSGYLPTEHTGKVTRADGRIVHEIDGRPAAVVYNEWAGGAIAGELDGGNVLLKTNLLPLARTKGLSLGMPRRLLSHPHQVIEKTGSLAFFTELSVGDTLTLMTTMREPSSRAFVVSFSARAGRGDASRAVVCSSIAADAWASCSTRRGAFRTNSTPKWTALPSSASPRSASKARSSTRARAITAISCAPPWFCDELLTNGDARCGIISRR